MTHLALDGERRVRELAGGVGLKIGRRPELGVQDDHAPVDEKKAVVKAGEVDTNSRNRCKKVPKLPHKADYTLNHTTRTAISWPPSPITPFSPSDLAILRYSRMIQSCLCSLAFPFAANRHKRKSCKPVDLKC